MSVKRKKIKSFLPFIVAFLAMGLLLGFWALDRFVINEEEQPIIASSQTNSGDASSQQTSSDGSSQTSSGGTSSEVIQTVIEEDAENGRWYYRSSAVEITILRKRDEFIGESSGRRVNTTYYVADIKITDADCLQRIVSSAGYGTGTAYKQNTVEMAAAAKAVLAISGDEYGYVKNGIEIVAGGLYRWQKRDTNFVAVMRDNTMKILKGADYASKDDAVQLLNSGCKFTLDFGPALIIDGNKVTDFSPYGRIGNWNPRSGVGYIDKNHYVFVVADGTRNDNEDKSSDGLGLPNLRDIFYDLGCVNAYNLDGGSSVTMIFNGKRINNIYTSRLELYDLVAVIDG